MAVDAALLLQQKVACGIDNDERRKRNDLELFNQRIDRLRVNAVIQLLERHAGGKIVLNVCRQRFVLIAQALLARACAGMGKEIDRLHCLRLLGRGECADGRQCEQRQQDKYR